MQWRFVASLSASLYLLREVWTFFLAFTVGGHWREKVTPTFVICLSLRASFCSHSGSEINRSPVTCSRLSAHGVSHGPTYLQARRLPVVDRISPDQPVQATVSKP